MKMKNICTLQFRKTEDVIKSIQDSGYGADVRYDENSDRYFVSVPCDADMW